MRAKFCEQLAATFGPTDSYTVAFMADLFSMIDGLLEIPMEQILQQLPLQPCITDALVHQRGERATYLKTINAYEQTDWLLAESVVVKMTTPPNLAKLYHTSVAWAQDIL